MSNASEDRGSVVDLLDRARAGDPGAREGLIRWACLRMGRRSSERLRRGFGALALVGVETGDVSQDLYLELERYLRDDPSRVPASEGALLALAGTMMNRRLIDMKRKHFGQGDRKRTYRSVDDAGPGHPLLRGTSGLGGWRRASQVRELIDRLPETHRGVVLLAHEFADDPPRKIEAICKLLDLHDPKSAYRRLRQALEAFKGLVDADDRRGDGP